LDGVGQGAGEPAFVDAHVGAVEFKAPGAGEGDGLIVGRVEDGGGGEEQQGECADESAKVHGERRLGHFVHDSAGKAASMPPQSKTLRDEPGAS
jgi:hypothetical protein